MNSSKWNNWAISHRSTLFDVTRKALRRADSVLVESRRRGGRFGVTNCPPVSSLPLPQSPALWLDEMGVQPELKRSLGGARTGVLWRMPSESSRWRFGVLLPSSVSSWRSEFKEALLEVPSMSCNNIDWVNFVDIYTNYFLTKLQEKFSKRVENAQHWVTESHPHKDLFIKSNEQFTVKKDISTHYHNILLTPSTMHRLLHYATTYKYCI